MEYCSGLKKKEVMPFAATWIDLERIISSEVSQKGKDKYYVVSLKCGIQTLTQTNLSVKQKLTHTYHNVCCPKSPCDRKESTGNILLVSRSLR